MSGHLCRQRRIFLGQVQIYSFCLHSTARPNSCHNLHSFLWIKPFSCTFLLFVLLLWNLIAFVCVLVSFKVFPSYPSQYMFYHILSCFVLICFSPEPFVLPPLIHRQNCISPHCSLTSHFSPCSYVNRIHPLKKQILKKRVPESLHVLKYVLTC